MPIRPEWARGDQISSDQPQTSWLSSYHDDASLLGMTCCHCSLVKDRLGNSLILHSLLLHSLLFNSYRPQHLSADLHTLQTDPSWPDVPTLVTMARARPCLYISALYFDSQALSLTWFSISMFLKASLVPSLSLISYISHSESSLVTLETSTPSKYLPPVHS